METDSTLANAGRIFRHRRDFSDEAASGERPTVAHHPHFPADRLAHYRAELFRIRETVLAIIAHLRDSAT